MHIHSPVFSGSITQANNAYVALSGSLTGSFTGDGSSLTNLPVPDNAISGATAALNTLTFTRGDGTTFTTTIHTGSGGGGGGVTQYSELSGIPAGIVSSSTQITSLGFVANSATSSFLTNSNTGSNLLTASAALNVVTFTKGDGTTFAVTVHTGSGAGGSLNYNSLLNVPQGILSSSAQIDALFDIDGLVSSSTQVVDHLPGGTVSGSAQTVANVSGSQIHVAAVTASSFVSTATGTPTLRAANNLILSSSNAVVINGGVLRLPNFANAETGSLTLSDGDLIYNTDRDKVLFYSASNFNEFGEGSGGSGVSSYPNLSNIPSGIVSSSAQLTGTTLENVILSGSGVVGISGSLIPEATSDSNGKWDLGSTASPFRDLYLTTSSINFIQDGELFVSMNAQQDAIRVGNILITTSSIKAIDNSDNSVVSIIETSNNGMTASLTLPYNADRTITSTDAGDFFGNNVGTTGSVTEFLDALFFPNQPPVHTLAANQSVEEFTTSGSLIFTVTATDADGDTVTFSAPDYTGNFLEINSTGQVRLKDSASTAWNLTDRGDGTLTHPFPVRASDPNSGEADRTYYLRVTPNTAPKFRQTSVSGTVITSVAQNRIESSGTGNVVTIYVTDDESDTITIESPLYSSSAHFDMITSSNSVTIRQQTGSLEFDGGITSYSFSVSASDEHGAQANIPITITVTDNAAPTFNNQTETGGSENSSAGTSFGTATATDSDSITFRNFTLAGLREGGSVVATGTYAGTNQATDPTENPFNMDSSGNITRKSGVYLNSDLIDTYIYSASAYDTFNDDVFAVLTIPVSDDPAPSITNNSVGGANTFYISETALSGSTVRTTTDGVGGSQADFGPSAVTWSVTPSTVTISNNGSLSVNSHISGAYSGSQTITGFVSASNNFGTQATQAYTISVVANSAPSVAFTLSSSLNTDFTTDGAHLGTIAITDTENNSPYGLVLNNNVTGSLELSPANAVSSSWNLSANGALTAGTYSVSVTASDSYGTNGLAQQNLVVTEASIDGLVYLYQTNTSRGAVAINTYIGIAGTDTNFNPVSASLETTYTNALHAFRDNTAGSGGSGLAASNVSGLYGNTTTVFREGALRSGSNLDTVLRQAEYATTNRTGHFIMAIASGSDMTGVPTTMRDSFGSSTVGEYVLSMGIDGTYGQEDGRIYQVALDEAHQGFREWIFIVMNGAGGGTAINPRITASSGSAPTN